MALELRFRAGALEGEWNADLFWIVLNNMFLLVGYG